MPETKRPPLTDIAPYPETRDEATAERMAKHFAAFGLMHDDIAMAFTGGQRDQREQFDKSIQYVIQSFSVVLLLREFRKQDAASADEAARALWTHREGGELAEWLWEWAIEYGIDPAQVKDVAAQVERNIRAKAAGQSEQPSGGES